MTSGAQFKPEYYSGKDNASPIYIIDGVNPALIVTVAQFHNSDNQVLPSTAYGLLTGGVDQLINASGNLDRKRAAYGDALASTGIEASGLMVWNGTTFDRWRGNSGIADNQLFGVAAVETCLYNGNGVDRQRGNIDNFVLQASGVITANGNSFDAVNYNGKGLKLFIKTGAFGSGASAITVTIQGKDPVSISYYSILTSASLTASTFTVLSVYPGLTASANVTANDVLPRTWNVAWNAANWGTGGSTLGISCAMIL